jgi:hypothetical protein
MCIIWTNKRVDNIKMHGATVKKEKCISDLDIHCWMLKQGQCCLNWKHSTRHNIMYFCKLTGVLDQHLQVW